MKQMESDPRWGPVQRGLRRTVRHVVVGATSVAVVAAAAAYVVAPSTQDVELTLVRVRLAASGDATGVVYGVVREADGEPIEGARVDAVPRPRSSGGDGRGGGGAERHARSAADGTFRLTVPPGRWDVRVSCVCGRGRGRGELELDVVAGRAYEIAAELRDDRTFVVVPVSGY